MKAFSISVAAMGFLLASFATQATVIKASYTISPSSDPGLVVHYGPVADNPFNLDLTVGVPQTFDLFNIWTNETALNSDDYISKPISANFSFIMPTAPDGSVTGATDGHFVFYCGGIRFGCEYGSVEWDGPTDFYFGAMNDGHFRISLSDETFNWGAYGGLHSGDEFGATVRATITLLQDATAVPEPGVLGMFGFGLLSLVLFLRRERRS